MTQNTPTSVTQCVRAGIERDSQYGAVVPPLHLSSNFAFEGFEQKRQYDYTRSGNPTRDILAEAICELEGGAGAVITSSGMAAVTLATHLLNADDLVVVPHDCYGGCYRAFTALAGKGHFKLQFADFTNADDVQRALSLKPRMVWLETPSNPLLRITDIESVSAQAREIDALVVVDNTFLSPLQQQPIALGADLVVHSTTKYINGHSDVVGGAVIAATQELADQIQWWANCIGVTGAPFDSFLTLRGIRTLQARLRLHQENTDAIVDKVAASDAVGKVHYPGLKSHPQHELARRQQNGFGAMISFELKGGTEEVRAFLDGLRYFSLAESLGGVESLVAHPASMTHAAMDPQARERAGINDGLIRLSVGIECAQDLIADLEAGLERANAIRRGSALLAATA